MTLVAKQTKLLYSLLIGSILLFGVLITLYGFWKTSPQVLIPWDSKSTLMIFYGCLLSAFFAVYLLSYIFKNTLLASLIIISLISLISNKVWSVGVVVWIVLSAVLLGRFILNKIQISNTWLDCFLLGIGILGSVIGLLAHFPVNYPGGYGLALALICFFGRKIIVEIFLETKRWYQDYKSSSSKFNKFFEVFTFALTLIYFIVALMPELGHDGLAMHLFIPAKLFHSHQWGFDVDKYVWAVMPMLADWIYSLAYMLGGETSAKLINLCFILVVCLLLKKIAGWASKSSAAGYIVCAIFLSSPLTFGVASNLLVEPIWSAFVIGGISILLQSNSQDSANNRYQELILAGTFMGFAVAGKVIAVLAIPSFLIILLIKHRQYFKRYAAPSIFFGVLSFIVISCIPYLTALTLTGNPVFPFFNKLFRSSLWSHENFSDPRWNSAIGIDFLYSLTFETGKYFEALPGAAGFQWLLFMPLCFILLIISRQRKGLLLLFISVIFIVLVFRSTVYLRYIFPAYALLCVVVGIGLVEVEKFSKTYYSVATTIAALALILNVTFISAPFFVYQDFPVQSILSDDHKNDYLAKNKPIRNIIQTVNLLNTNRKPVAIVSDPLGAELNSDALYTNWYNRKWQQSFDEANTEQKMVDLLSEYKVEYLIVDDSFKITKEQKEALQNVTDRVAQISYVQLRKIKGPRKELLINPNLEGTDGWQIPSDDLYNQSSKTVTVDEKSPTVQRVNVDPDRLYQAQVNSRCLSAPTQGRVQVNWHDKDEKFIKASIKVFDCTTSLSENSMEMTSPPNAFYAYFYLTSHANTKIEIKGASLKE